MSLAVSSATVTVLPDCPAASIEIVDRRGTRLEFVSAQPLLPGTLIRVESGDALWFAEVLASTIEDIGFRILANVEHYLPRSESRRPA